MTERKIHTAVLVEDEPLARKTLRDMLARADWLQLVGEAADGLAAVELIERQKPDLVFLDIHLPEMSGLDVLSRLTHEPAVIFTTAHDRHAIAAFELAAVDYLLKPFGAERLDQALLRAKEHLGRGANRETVERVRGAIDANGSGPLERILIRDGGRIVPVAVREIERIEADGDYAAVHAKSRRFLVSLPLSDFEERLDPARFLRVHRAHLVNLDFVDAIDPQDNSQLVLRMRNGDRIPASRSASKRLRERAI